MLSPHTVHIPVMGTGFTVDTPVKVAHFGISSVMSIGDDVLLEQMREYLCGQYGRPFHPIEAEDKEYRVRRITAYLDLIGELVKQNTEQLRQSRFQPGSLITRYFEMLPEGDLKQAYREMLDTVDMTLQEKRQAVLRESVTPGYADVNIMTRLDGDRYFKGKVLPPEDAVAMSALRGFALSSLNSSVVFSAGLNRRLYSYVATFNDFLPDTEGRLKKRVILKVSDYRSAIIQGTFLAKRGVWVSEFRVESGLNCGGHAFATKGLLLGPILEEFSTNRETLVTKLHAHYTQALKEKGLPSLEKPFPIRLTVQGGIGTRAEDLALYEYYDVDGTGWGTPFLLVPEATNLDDTHIHKLSVAGKSDVHLSINSPLGVPFWLLKNSTSEQARKQRIESGHPGSACPKRYLSSDTEFSTRPLCRASQAYQSKKLDQINATEDDARRELARNNVIAKTCLCMDLAAAATRTCNIEPEAPVAVCCGPGIADYGKPVSLSDMMDHIYGRINLIINHDRPHMFIREFELYLDFLKDLKEQSMNGLLDITQTYFADFVKNLAAGAESYQRFAESLRPAEQGTFLSELQGLTTRLRELVAESGLLSGICLASPAASNRAV